jgi:hypothetical protein
VWTVRTPNANKVSDTLREPNFGLIEIDWAGPEASVTLSVQDQHGARRIEKRLPLVALSPQSWRTSRDRPGASPAAP